MKLIKIALMLVMTTVIMASCLKSSDTEVTLYSDAVITNFTLGTLNKYVDGTKSTYSASTYLFNIDQSDRGTHKLKDTTIVGRCIYLADSLPLGTDLKHVVSTITTLNNGTAIIEDLDDPDSWLYYSSLDSIDFSKPRKVRVYSSDGEAYNQYFISVDAHQEDGEKFVWKLMRNDWQPSVEETQTLPDGIKKILGSSTTEQYALSTDNKLMVSHDKGVTWQEEKIAEDADKLPTRDLSLVSYPLAKTDSTDYVLLIGNREVNEQNTESTAMVWRKVVDYSQRAPKAYWTYIERDAEDETYSLPRMADLTMVKYDDGVLAFGAEGIGGCDITAPYSEIYQSRDNGITWKLTSRYAFPEDFDFSASDVKAVVDSDNFIWLYCTGTGEVWRGRLNRLGWKK